ncbi:hypothetical protein [Anditalea andensis]|nr:hypothetical protein [Anditalea andensis]
MDAVKKNENRVLLFDGEDDLGYQDDSDLVRRVIYSILNFTYLVYGIFFKQEVDNEVVFGFLFHYNDLS